MPKGRWNTWYTSQNRSVDRFCYIFQLLQTNGTVPHFFFIKTFFYFKFFQKNSCTVPVFHSPRSTNLLKRTKHEQNPGVPHCGTNRFNLHFLTVEMYHKISYLIIQKEPVNLSLQLLKPFLFFPHFLNHVIQYHILPYKNPTERSNIQNES